MTKKIRNVAIYTLLAATAVISIFPIVWMLFSSTNLSSDILKARFLPGMALKKNFEYVLKNYDLIGCLFRSLRNSVCQTVLAMLVCSMAGYGFEIFRDKKKDAVMRMVLMAMMVPTISIVIPLYQMFSSYKMLNTMWACILPGVSTPLMIFLFRQNTRNFPREVIQAARIDGMNELQIFTRIYMPVMTPSYVTGITITFMNAWNSFLWPSIVLVDNKQITMPILLSLTMTGYYMDYGAIMLTVTLCTLPTIVIFLLLQKYFVNGVAGAVKG